MKTVSFKNIKLNFQPLPSGQLTYNINWNDKPHRNQFIKKEKAIIDLNFQKEILFGTTLITQELWLAIMGDNPSTFKEKNNPVENVSFDNVEIFIAKLNEKTNLKFRLPTESEFLYACLLNYNPPDICSLEDYSWYEGNSNRQTQNVNSKLGGNFLLADLVGNLYQFLIADITTVSNKQCIYRGASWATQILWVDKDYSMTANKSYKSNTVGFRLILTQ